MGSIDVSVKHSYALRPDDWAKFLRVPDGSRVRAVDSDVSSLATIADKVFEVDGPITLLLHLEPMLGLRFDEKIAAQFLRNVRDIMRESVTYRSIIEEGLEEGLERGRGEGKLEGRRDAILLMGRERFGEPTHRMQKKLTAINNPQELDALIKRVLHVSSWQELLASSVN